MNNVNKLTLIRDILNLKESLESKKTFDLIRIEVPELGRVSVKATSMLNAIIELGQLSRHDLRYIKACYMHIESMSDLLNYFEELKKIKDCYFTKYNLDYYSNLIDQTFNLYDLSILGDSLEKLKAKYIEISCPLPF